MKYKVTDSTGERYVVEADVKACIPHEFDANTLVVLFYKYDREVRTFVASFSKPISIIAMD